MNIVQIYYIICMYECICKMLCLYVCTCVCFQERGETWPQSRAAAFRITITVTSLGLRRRCCSKHCPQVMRELGGRHMQNLTNTAKVQVGSNWWQYDLAARMPQSGKLL